MNKISNWTQKSKCTKYSGYLLYPWRWNSTWL